MLSVAMCAVVLMFSPAVASTLVSMSQYAEMPPLNWSELGVSELPTGTVTLLLADVEGSTRLWETRPEEMTAALARLDRVVTEAIAAHHGVRPVEQGEGDSFVAAFARASDAVACALALQRAPLAPIRLRIGVHTGEIQLRDEGNYIGPTINRTARLRDLAHGGQTVLSGATEPLVADHLPGGRVVDRSGRAPATGSAPPGAGGAAVPSGCAHRVPAAASHRYCCVAKPSGSVDEFRRPAHRDGGVARTRRRAPVGHGDRRRRCRQDPAGGGGRAERLGDEFRDGVWYVDLAPVTDPVVVPVTVARALGLPDQPGRYTRDTLLGFIGQKTMLLVFDNCEHLLDACGSLIIDLLDGCPQLTVLATSRESLGVAGELSWRVPSLSVADEAVELFTDRARHVRPAFRVGEDDAVLVGEICRRLDGMPLAIELAAARVRALSLAQIADGLHDRFRLLTGGARSAVRRQQTLRASVDWSHALLTEPERVLFRRLAVFAGGFDLEAAEAVGAESDAERYQLLDQLGLLVDKSLVRRRGQQRP